MKLGKLPEGRTWRSAFHLELPRKHIYLIQSTYDELIIFEYQVAEDRWMQGPFFKVEAYKMTGLFAWKGQENVVLFVFKPGRIVAIDCNEYTFHSPLEEHFKDLFKKQNAKMQLIYAFETTRNLNAKGIVAGDKEQGIHYFLDYSNVAQGWTPLNGIKDPTFGNYVDKGN